MSQQTNPQASLPLTETVLLILLSLAPRPKHGYAIMQEVAALSQDRVQLSTGTLYGALKRLLEQEWIEPVAEGETATEPATPPRGRKAYQLTDWGRRILQAEATRLQALATVARRQLAESAAL